MAKSLTRLPHKATAVKIDRIGAGLIVDDLPFFPVGFYCYSPVQPGLVAEEVVRGFNTVSPYQSNAPESLAERQEYMDRCARLGMKVHYQLLSVAGGGGAAAADETGERKALLRAEVEAFRDHPALLAWNISDEPTGHSTPPRGPEAFLRSGAQPRPLPPHHHRLHGPQPGRRVRRRHGPGDDRSLPDPQRAAGLRCRRREDPRPRLRARQAGVARTPGLRRQRVVVAGAHGARAAGHDLAGHRRGRHGHSVLHPPRAEPLPQVAAHLGRLRVGRPGGIVPDALATVSRGGPARGPLSAGRGSGGSPRGCLEPPEPASRSDRPHGDGRPRAGRCPPRRARGRAGTVRRAPLPAGRGRCRVRRLVAQAIGRCPPWHGGAGGPAWLFVDEIRINPEDPVEAQP